jgi:citrate lyase subunit beta/citryl-CoA lyase
LQSLSVFAAGPDRAVVVQHGRVRTPGSVDPVCHHSNRRKQDFATMSTAVRPRRSVLFMPASNARALEKARGLPADGLIFDLEDAVAPDAKSAARDGVGQSLVAGGYGRREVMLRVNALTTDWGHADLVAAALMPIDAVVLPKVESADAVRQAQAVLAGAGAPQHLPIWCMIETPRGVLRAEEIASASDRVTGLIMGTADLTKDLRARHMLERLPLLTAFGHCLLVARACGLAILDGVHLDLADDAGFLAACHQARALGFDGKTLIHPKTIAAANMAFAPSSDEVAAARRIIAAHAEAISTGKGIVVVDGRLIENLHVQDAHQTVALAEAISALERADGG